MNRGDTHKKFNEEGVASMIEYISITATLVALFIVMLLLVNTYFMQGPLDTLTYSAFTDIGNGVSTRMVDVYAIAPANGNLTSVYKLPTDIAGQNYGVEIVGDSSGQTVTIYRNSISSQVALSGIGASQHGNAIGNTTGGGVNLISYDSGGV